MNIKRLKSWCGTLAHYNGIWVSGKHGFSKTLQRQKNSEIIFQINIVDSVLTPPTCLQPFHCQPISQKMCFVFSNRCAEPDIHYVDKVIFIRWYFVGQTMVDNVCGDRKQVIAVNDPNSSLNYPHVHTNKMYNSVIPITITNYHVWSLIIDQYTDITVTNIIILVATIPSCIPTFGGTTRYLTISQSDTISSQIISHEQHLNWNFRISMLTAQVRDTHLIKTLVTKKATLTLCIFCRYPNLLLLWQYQSET